MVFAMPSTASAYNTYVGLKIESVNNPNVGSPTEWCLPSGVTTMTINDGSEDIDTVTTSSDTCPGDTIWSGLVTLTSGSYQITLAYTPDYVEVSGFMWFGELNYHSSCTNYCASLGRPCVDPGIHDVDVSCANFTYLTGCTGSCGSRDYDVMPAHTGKIYRQSVAGNYTCDGIKVGYGRICCCGGTPLCTWSFTFQAP